MVSSFTNRRRLQITGHGSNLSSRTDARPVGRPTFFVLRDNSLALGNHFFVTRNFET